MRILIVGDQRWNDSNLITEAIKKYDSDKDIILHHKRGGASLIGMVVGRGLGFKTEMVEDNILGDTVLIFHNYIRNSKNSLNIAMKCQEKNIPYQVIEREK